MKKKKKSLFKLIQSLVSHARLLRRQLIETTEKFGISLSKYLICRLSHKLIMWHILIVLNQ